MTEPNHKTLTGTIVGWLREHGTSQHQLAELDRLDGPEVDRMAHDTGMSVAELRSLAGSGPHAADLLPERMAAVGIDPDAFAATEPAAFRDLQRLCATCRAKGECAHDLASPLTSEALPDYCVNRDTLRALGAQDK